MNNTLAVFENFKIRRIYDEKTETWFFSVVDIVQALIQQPDYQAARNYWKVLKNRLNKEGSEVVTKCNRLKMIADDGKMRLTDAANPETLLRIIPSMTPNPTFCNGQKFGVLNPFLPSVEISRLRFVTDSVEIGLGRASRCRSARPIRTDCLVPLKLSRY